eukprot:PhM_4_TR16617/c0_g1_i1/m.20768
MDAIISASVFVVPLLAIATTFEWPATGWFLSSTLNFTFTLRATLSLCLAATLLSILQILSHLLHYNEPRRQRFVIRILLMVPIYAIDSFASFYAYGSSTYIDVARDTYEAYVLYNFFHLLMDLLGGDEATVSAWHKAGMKRMPHSFPVSLVYKDFALDKSTLQNFRIYLIQYVIISPLMTIVQFILSYEGLFDDSNWDFLNNGHIYIAVIRCVSVTFAFTALFYFYLATKKLLHHYHPTGKFIAIKLVVFLSFWQAVVVGQIGARHWLPHSWKQAVFSWSEHLESVTDETLEINLENIMLLCEMLVTAVLHHFVFSYKEFEDKNNNKAKKNMSFVARVFHAFSITDVWGETKASTKTMIDNKKKQ